jgi:hypothetical protein
MVYAPKSKLLKEMAKELGILCIDIKVPKTSEEVIEEFLERLVEEFKEACKEGNFNKVLNIIHLFETLSDNPSEEG